MARLSVDWSGAQGSVNGLVNGAKQETFDDCPLPTPPQSQAPSVCATVSWFTGSIAPFSVKIARISEAGVTSKAGL